MQSRFICVLVLLAVAIASGAIVPSARVARQAFGRGPVVQKTIITQTRGGGGPGFGGRGGGFNNGPGFGGPGGGFGGNRGGFGGPGGPGGFNRGPTTIVRETVIRG
uniref:Glycine-rich cell wall structural protein-like n=1 Tax=Panagrellus redivivus TaxID=6233 RepID=A0A7E4ZTW3_PANRE